MSPDPLSYAYSRYLSAKKSVDDRALNRHVLDELRRLLPAGPAGPAGPSRIVEIGAGLGTMVARLLEWGVVGSGEYILLDVDRRLLLDARQWLGGWAAARGVPCEPRPDGLCLGDLRVRLVEAELGSYLTADSGEPAAADLVIAHAFLDLVDVPAVLPGLFRLLVPGGVYWFTANFDGETIFTPDHPRDDDVLRAYHRTMDDRVRYGRPAGESRTGRRLFAHLQAAGAPPVASGSSDWVVHAGPDGDYPGDEAAFLENILETIQHAWDGREGPAGLADWLAVRRRQLAAGELVYIAHQLDFTGRSPG
jgi:SAM-dependent methyltransferase